MIWKKCSFTFSKNSPKNLQTLQIFQWKLQNCKFPPHLFLHSRNRQRNSIMCMRMQKSSHASKARTVINWPPQLSISATKKITLCWWRRNIKIGIWYHRGIVIYVTTQHAIDVDFQILFCWCNFAHKNVLSFTINFDFRVFSRLVLRLQKLECHFWDAEIEIKILPIVINVLCFRFLSLSRNGSRLYRTWTNDVGRCWHYSTSAAGDRPPRRSQQWTTCGEFLLSISDFTDISCHRL